MATIRYRKYNIAKFIMSDGREVVDHNEKAAILFSAYKQRLGQSTAIVFPPELANLISRVDGLEELSTDFSTKEIDEVIAHMPVDKAPGPDGFNGKFIKSY